MIQALAMRGAQAALTVLLSVMLSFSIIHFAPGDALSVDAGQSGRSVESRAMLRTRYGLNAPLTTQFARYAFNALHGDLGYSLLNERPVAAAVGDALKNTLLLSSCALLAATILGMSVGILEGWRSGWWLSRALGSVLTGLYAIPEFVLAIALLATLSFALGWFPVGGTHDAIVDVTGTRVERGIDLLHHLVLPALTLALGWGAAVGRQQRVALLESVRADHVRTARAKGSRASTVLLQHAVRPSLAPVVAVIGLMLPILVSGAVVVEVVFAWPGMGSLLLHAVAQRDVPMIAGAMLLLSAAVAVSSVIIEVVVQLLDPRQRMIASR